MNYVLPAEWHEQCAVQLTWPHAATDWLPILAEVTRCYIDMAREISARVHLIIVSPEPAHVRALLAEHLSAECLRRTFFCQAPTNDTWARDHSFISLLTPDGPHLLDFRFNGWGEKFSADLDNQICRRMMEQDILKGQYENHLDFVLEGGSIESDGKGTILTTSQCLLAPHRNQPLSQAQIEQRLLTSLHAKRILWLDHGYLAGDDTDSHIDTLARFCPNNTIAYVRCTDPNDEHYEALTAMEAQLKTFESFQLLPLPLPSPILDPDDGHRLPATYANFLVINHAVLLPTYGQPENDDLARSQLQKAFPKYDIVPIDCRVLIRQHGSLHCSTMQYPVGVLS